MKTEKELKLVLNEFKKDDRLYYPSAEIGVNSVLAMIQLELAVRIHTLEKVLELPLSKFPLKKRKRK